MERFLSCDILYRYLRVAVLFLAFVITPKVSQSADSYSVPDSSNLEISEHSVCHDVINAIGYSLFVPTKTPAEWASFYNNPPAGVTLGACGNTPTVLSYARYRSVGPGNTSALATGASNGMTISGSIATFVSPLPDNIGMGDALQYDSDGDGDIDSSDTIIFIHERFDSQNYYVQTAGGADPSDLGVADNDWSIFRAYTALNSVNSGAENTGIDSDLRNFDTHTNGLWLASSSEQWNIVLYADGEDTATVYWDNWTTTATYNLVMFTPTEPNEVGVSQRHTGSPTGGGYKFTGNQIYIENLNMEIHGLFLEIDNATTDIALGGWHGSSVEQVYTDNLVILTSAASGAGAISTRGSGGSSASSFYYANNILVCNCSHASSAALFTSTPPVDEHFIYNNTLYNDDAGYALLSNYDGDHHIKNNIGYTPSAEAFKSWGGTYVSSQNNLSSDDTADDFGGTGNLINQTVTFNLESSYDLRLHQSDTGAAALGVDLSGDSDYAFDLDILENTRIVPWDIGATIAGANQTEGVPFGENEMSITDAGHNDERIQDFVIKGDGSIYMVGWGLTYNYRVTKLNPDGSVDGQFGTNGHMINSGGSPWTPGLNADLMADGDVIVAAYQDGSPDDYVLRKYDESDGSLVTAWASSGELIDDISTSDIGSAKVHVLGSGQFLVYGESDGDLFVGRFDADGTLDTAFGSSGYRVVSPSGGYVRDMSLITLSDGTIIVGGRVETIDRVFFARMDEDGTMDTSYSGDGYEETNLGANGAVNDMVVNSDDSFYASFAGSWVGCVIGKQNSDMSADLSFNGTGFATSPNSCWDREAAIARDSSDRVLVATKNGSNNIEIRRYTTAGALDTTHATSGIKTYDSGGNDTPVRMKFDSNSNVFIGVNSNFAGDKDFSLFKYTP